MSKANTTRGKSNKKGMEAEEILAELNKIQAMVAASRHTIRRINDNDVDHACILLMEADNRIFYLKSEFEQKGGAA